MAKTVSAEDVTPRPDRADAGTAGRRRVRPARRAPEASVERGPRPPRRPPDPTVAALRREQNPLKRLARLLGPGLITGASDDDPSGIGTYATAGASLGYSTLWMALVTFPTSNALGWLGTALMGISAILLVWTTVHG